MLDTTKRSRWLVGVSFLFMMALLPFSSYVVVSPFLQTEWDASNTSSGLIFSSYLLGYAVSSLFIVPLTDRFAIVRILVVGLVIMFTGHLLFPIAAHGILSAIVWRALAGIGHVAAYQSGIRMVSERFPVRNRGSAVGFFVAAGFGGTTLSYSVTGQLLAYTESWRYAYFFTALIGPLTLLALYFTLLHGQKTRTDSAKVDATGEAKQAWLLDISVLRRPPIRITTLIYALHTAELYLARLWFPMLLTSAFVWAGDSPETASIRSATISGPMFMVGVAGVLAGGYLSDRIGRVRGAMSIFMASGTCSFAVGWLISAPELLLIAGFIYGLTTAADSAILSAAIVEFAPTNRVGSAQAIQSFIGFLIGAIVPVLAGYILDHTAQEWRWIIAFSLNGLLALFGIILLARLSTLVPVVAYTPVPGPKS